MGQHKYLDFELAPYINCSVVSPELISNDCWDVKIICLFIESCLSCSSVTKEMSDRMGEANSVCNLQLFK